MAPVTDQISEVWEESKPTKPILFLLAPGSDPTNTIDELARKKRIQTQKVSMGEEQEIIALKNINDAMRDGFWVILNNCHLSLEFMAEIDRCVSLASKHHLQFAIVREDIRRVVANRFPYIVYFRAEKHRIVVLAVLHGSRDPTIWQARA